MTILIIFTFDIQSEVYSETKGALQHSMTTKLELSIWLKKDIWTQIMCILAKSVR